MGNVILTFLFCTSCWHYRDAKERTNFPLNAHLRFEMDNEEIKHSAVRFSTEKQLFPRHLKSAGLLPTNLFTVWLWKKNLTSLSLSVLLYKVGITIAHRSGKVKITSWQRRGWKAKVCWMLAVRQGLSSLHIHSLNKSLCASYLAPRSLASLVAQLVKNPPATWETWVQSLG